MLFSFICPIYNNIALTKRMYGSFLDTVSLGADSELIFVDDGSSDGTREWLNALGESVSIVFNEENRGYANACNRGASVATGDFLVFLNNDVFFLPGWWGCIASALKKCPEIGILGNAHLKLDGVTIDHLGVQVSPRGQISHIIQRNDSSAGCIDVFACSAAVFGIRSKIFRELSGFDESFINGGEDIDLCLRVSRRGWRVCVQPSSKVLHAVSATRGVVRNRDRANSLRLLIKWRKELAEECSKAWFSLIGDGGFENYLYGGEVITAVALHTKITTSRMLAERVIAREILECKAIDTRSLCTYESAPWLSVSVISHALLEIRWNRGKWLCSLALKVGDGFGIYLTSNLILNGVLSASVAKNTSNDCFIIDNLLNFPGGGGFVLLNLSRPAFTVDNIVGSSSVRVVELPFER